MTDSLPSQVATAILGRPQTVVSQRACSGGFSGATVFRLETSEGTFALRAWPRSGWPRHRLTELHRFLEFLHQNGLPVAVPIASRSSGDRLHTAVGREWQLEPWLPGSPLKPGAVSRSQLQSLMQFVSRLHQVSAEYVCTRSGRKWFSTRTGTCPATRERLAIVDRWPAARCDRARQSLALAPHEFCRPAEVVLRSFQRESSRLRDALQAATRWQVPCHPCWRDLWSEHVLFEEDIASGVIDASAARIEHPASDLSRLLGSLLEDDHLLWGEALKLYGEIRPLSEVELQLTSLLDRSSVLLSGLTWIERSLNGQIPGEKLSAVCDRMNRFAHRAARLA